MRYSDKKVAGALLFIATSQFVFGLVVAEALYPGYSISLNYVSDLGVGPSSSMIFNTSVFLMGLLVLIGAYFLQRAFDYRILTVLLVLTAMGAMGVGVFTEDFGPIHSVVSLIAFLFGGLATIFSVVCSRVNQLKLLKMPFSVIVAALGLMSLGSLVLFIAKVDLGLGFGGMERMIVYPLLVWGAGFGGHLIGLSEDQAIQQKSKSS